MILSTKKNALLIIFMHITMLFYAQIIPTTISLSPNDIHAFSLEKDQMSLTNLTSSQNFSANELFYYNGGVGSNYRFLVDYYRYKFAHPGISNSDITNVTYSFNFAAHDDINHPTQPAYWSTSAMYVLIPPSTCNTNYWGSYTLGDCGNTENCINNGSTILAYISPNGNPSNITLTQSQSINASSSPNLSALLLDPNDFTIAFKPDGGTTCYIDLKNTITAQVTYNTYPIANNTISGNQSYTGSTNPTIITGATPTGGNKNTFTYQWQSSLDNSTWTNISGATAANYDPPTISQTTYYRRITYSAPQPSSTSNIVTITITPLLTPPTPTGLTSYPTGPTSMYLSWNSSSTATSYDIYTCSGSFIANVTSTNYTHTGLTPSTNYNYKVFAKNSYGNSPATSCVSGTTPSGIPSAPSGLTASSTSPTSIYLNWNSSPSATSYDIYTCTGTFIANVSTTNYTHTGLTPSTTYSYKIVAKNSYGNSPASSCANGTTLLIPATPTNFIGAPDSQTSIHLFWYPSNGATVYEIFDCSGTNIASVLASSFSTTNPNYIVTGLISGNTYNFKITAKNANGSSLPTACINVPTAISAPTGLIISGTCNQATIGWNSVNGASSYEIYKTNPWQYIGTTTSTSYIINTVASGTIGQYQVEAIQSGVGGMLSAAISYNIPPYSSSTSQVLCPGTTSSLLNVTDCGSTTRPNIQWQSSVCGGVFQDIPSATSSSYLVTSAASTGTSFRAKLVYGASTYYSNVQKISQYNVCNPTIIPGCGVIINPNRMGLKNNNTDNEEVNEIIIFPNPTSDEITIEFSSAENAEISVSIYDLLGKIIYNTVEKSTSTSFKHSIDVTKFNRGVYFIKINENNTTHINKVILE